MSRRETPDESRKIETVSKKIVILKIVLTFGLLALVFRKVELARVLKAFAAMNVWWLAAALAVNVIIIAGRWLKWHQLLESALGISNMKEAFDSFMGGMGFAVVTPGRAGEIARCLFHSEGNKVQISGLVVVDRLVDLLVILALAAYGFSLIAYWKMMALMAGASVVLAVCLLSIERSLKLGRRLVRWKRLDKIFDSLKAVASSLPRQTLYSNFLIAMLVTLLDLLVLWFLLLAFGSGGLRACAFVFPILLLANVAPFSISGIGVREGAAVYLFEQFHVAGAVAFNASFMLYVINSLLPGILGMALFYRIKVAPSEMEETGVAAKALEHSPDVQY